MSDKTTTISATTKDTADRPKGWKMTTLGEVAEINPSESLKQGTVAKYVAMENLQPFTRHISKYETKEFTGGMKFRNGDTLLARITPCLENGKTAYVDVLNDNEVGFGSTEYIVFREKINLSDKKFLYYLSISPRFRELAIKAMTGTSGRQRVQTDQLINELLILPDLPEQRAIAAVLSSLDDKIELLHEQNKTLEATAQTIFKEWFVNFNFPGATGKMIDSELGKIPEGWEVEKITDIFEFIKGSEPGAANYSNEKSNSSFVPFYRVQDISQYGDVPSIYVEEKLLKGKIFGQDDILISLDGTIGRVFIGGSGGHSGGIRRVIEKQDYIKKSLIFCFLKSAKFQNDLKSFSEAETTIKHAGGAVEYMKFVLNEKICERFGETIDPLFQKIISNISQIQTLSALRDTLLPKLMKGEVRVKGFIE